ncbi:MAG: hydroxypyruvate isomerase family protein [Silicimonas sp.]|nr:hydroxypyruvate isomerase family protein [Silicimonas sp.]
MPRFSANVSMMFTEHTFLDRFAAARDAGFEAVEFQFPYDHAPDEIGRAVRDNGLAVSVFNLSPGDWQSGERGFAALPGREAGFRATVTQALPYAEAVGAKRLHAMAGIAKPGADTEAVFLDNIRYGADRLAEAGLELLIEPINPRAIPGYFLSTTSEATALIKRIAHPGVRLQFDIFHHQITRGDVIQSLTECRDLIGHIQIAGVPDRHEPDIGELNYADIFQHVDSLGYSGWIGCEYTPKAGTREGLGWLRDLGGTG